MANKADKYNNHKFSTGSKYGTNIKQSICFKKCSLHLNVGWHTYWFIKYDIMHCHFT